MGLSAWNAYRARKAAEEKAIEKSLKQQPTSPPVKGVEVEPLKMVEDEPIAIKKKKKVK